MPGSPGLYFAHQNSLFLSGLVFMCQQDTVCFQCYGRECNNQRELGQVIYKKESPFTRKALFMKFQEWEIGCWRGLEIKSPKMGKTDNSVIDWLGDMFNNSQNNSKEMCNFNSSEITMKGTHFTFPLFIWWITHFFIRFWSCFQHLLCTRHSANAEHGGTRHIPAVYSMQLRGVMHMWQVTHSAERAQRPHPWSAKGEAERGGFQEKLMFELGPERWVGESASCSGQKRGGSPRGQGAWYIVRDCSHFKWTQIKHYCCTTI